MDKKAIILSGILWSDTYQRHQSIANYLANQGYKVLFIEGIPSSKFTINKFFKHIKVILKRLKKNNHINRKKNIKGEKIEIISEKFINPGMFFDIWNIFCAKKILRNLDNECEIIINYLPTETTKYFWDNLKAKIKIYDCVRDFENWGGYSKNIVSIEKYLVNTSSYVFVDSYYLVNKFKKMNLNNKLIQILPTIDAQQLYIYNKAKLKKKIRNILYFGTIDYHIDVSILNNLALQGYTVHIIGVIDSFEDINKNIVVHGFLNDLEELARKIIEIADAIIIPYIGNMDGVIPAKLMQSIATGLPIFINSFYDSNYLREYLYVYSNKEELNNMLENYNIDNHEKVKKKMIKFVQENLSEVQYRKIDRIIKE